MYLAQRRARRNKVRAATKDWPVKPREVAMKIAAKYGDLDEVTASMLIWHQRGPWKRVPTDKIDDVAAYDGSVIVERTKGELSARCDDERMNFLALNLAHDVATGAKDVDAARMSYAEAAMAVMANKSPAYTQALQFKRTAAATADPDQPLKPQTAARR